MSRAGVLVLALWAAGLALPGRALAQEASGMLGLPLVVKENGWARYVSESEESGRTDVVVRLGGSERHKGKLGRWVFLEAHVPETGRVSLGFLVADGRFSARHFLKVRVLVPGHAQQESDQQLEKVPDSALKPKVLRKLKETIAGRTLDVTEYSFEDGTLAAWSPTVPPLGITRVTGPQQTLTLVAFGVGGDPWKGVDLTPVWPGKVIPPPPPTPAGP